jgi:adenylosuccinate synthase
MPATIIVGAQWGDEGKGRVADWLAGQSDVVARFAGGDNAGHTVNVGSSVYKLHLIPSGILHPDVTCVLGNGTVVNPVNLLREMNELRALGLTVTPERLKLSTKAHIITPAHIAQDAASEKARGAGAIGTTMRGIGPAYMDKTGRSGIRAGLMRDPEGFADALHAQVERVNPNLTAVGMTPLDPVASAQEYLQAAQQLAPYLTDTTHYLNERLASGAVVLCEGAQGTMLDIDHGDYPYVTSSSPTAGGAMTGLGFGPTHVTRVVGVAKCFATRVGHGPFPTELHDDRATRLRGTGANFWDEYGVTTGRARRCGWLDMVMLRYALLVNGFTELVLTKLDVLSGFASINLCTAYEQDGQRLTYPTDVGTPTPLYETLPGWDEPLGAVRAWADLPANARLYVERIEAVAGVPVRTISVGPERDQLIHRG